MQFLNLTRRRKQRRQRRIAPLFISAAGHLAAFFLLMHAPEIRLPDREKSEYQLAIQGHEQKLVWYRFKELPDVTPPSVRAERRPLRAKAVAKQQIIASRKDAPQRTQMVWTPTPELKELAPVESPNILAIRMPEIRKAFVAPRDIQRPAPATPIVRADAPELKAAPLAAVKLLSAPKITRQFVPPVTKVPVKITEVQAPAEAPQLAPTALASAALNPSFKAPPRPFTAPQAKPGPAPGKPLVEEGPPALGSQSNVLAASLKDLNVAVVGLNPANKPAALPANSAAGQFSAGPKIRPDGADAAGDEKGLTVPDLFVRGARDAKPDLIAQVYAPPTSALTLRAAARAAEKSPAAGVADPATASHAAATKVSGAPEKRFTGRDVYMMAIQMPNLTSYSGSWLMWYADRTARETGLSPVSPPVAYRKVDPKYVAAAASDRIEGKVQLACVIGKNGRVSTVELVRGLDDRLNESAVNALAKWEFTPATRNGEPVEVDVLVEIPFRLAPRTQVKF